LTSARADADAFRACRLLTREGVRVVKGLQLSLDEMLHLIRHDRRAALDR
jgi:hypothetical protein